MNKMKKVFSLILAFVMCVSLFANWPMPAFAIDENSRQAEEVTATPAPSAETAEDTAKDNAADTANVQTTDAAVECSCGNTGADVIMHSDECNLKLYYKNLADNNSAEEIYAQWNNIPEDAQYFIQNYLMWNWDANREKTASLNQLIEKGEIAPTPIPAPVPGIIVPEVGDYAAISANMELFAEKAEQLTSYEECQDMYFEMLETYSAAFDDNNVLVLGTDQLAELDLSFDSVEATMKDKFGSEFIPDSTAIPRSAAFNLANNIRTGTATDGIGFDKTVTPQPNENGEFILTLQAYATGHDTTITVTKPADIVIAVDQSGSMYTPSGFSSNGINTKLSNPAEHPNAETYDLEKVISMFEDGTVDEDTKVTYAEKFSQLGYLVAQSQVQKEFFCDLDGNGTADYDIDHTHTDNCSMLDTWDWFIVQYVAEDTDTPWYFYRVWSTSVPSRDADTWSGTGTDKDTALEKYTLLTLKTEEIAGNRFVFYKSQYGALYDALKTYIESTIRSGIDHRIAVAGFASASTDAYGHCSTGSGVYINGEYILYDDKDKSGINPAIPLGTYQKALVSTSTEADSIRNSVKALVTDFYGTCHFTGLDMAYNILSHATDVPTDDPEIGRDKIVILFTDGTPSCSGCSRTHTAYSLKEDGTLTAESGIDTVGRAYDIKKDLGAAVFTIKTSMAGNENLMNFASSNYPDAVDKSNSTKAQRSADKYALDVANSADLKNAFTSVSDEMAQTTVTLDTETVLKDVISDQFVLPDGATEDNAEEYVKIYTREYKGTGSFTDSDSFKEKIPFDAVIAYHEETKTIEVSNFNYSAEFLSATEKDGAAYPYGRKLIVEIPIVPTDDFLGGDQVVTNKPESGIYDDGNSVATFPKPEVDVPLIEITPDFLVEDIYLSEQAYFSSVLNLGIFKDKNGEETTIDGINNRYAEIVYTLTDHDNNVMTYTIPAGTSYEELADTYWSGDEDVSVAPLLKEDTVYKITCTVTSINDKTTKPTYIEVKDTIHVFKPFVFFRDGTFELGNFSAQSRFFSKENFVNVAWVHLSEDENGNTVITNAKQAKMGEPPELKYDYTVQTNRPYTADVPVKVKVTACKDEGNIPVPADQNITEYTTFYRCACDFDGCTHTKERIVTGDAPNFVVHVMPFDIVINKSGADMSLDTNQSFVFEITNPDGYTFDVVIEGNGSVVIKDLPVKAQPYSVEELMDWSWRYETVDENGTPVSNKVEIAYSDVHNGVYTVEFINNRTESRWLDGNSRAQNLFINPIKQLGDVYGLADNE